MVNPEFHDEGFRVRHCLSCRKVGRVLTRWRRGVVEFSSLSCGLVNFSVALQFLGFRCGKVWSWWHHGWVFGIGGCFDVVFIGHGDPSSSIVSALHGFAFSHLFGDMVQLVFGGSSRAVRVLFLFLW